MNIRDKYDDYLKNQTNNLESDEITKKIIKDYYQEENLKEQWGKILRDEHNYESTHDNKPDPSDKTNKNGNIKRFLTVALIGLAASLFWFFNNTASSTIIPVSPVDQLLSEHYAKPFTRDVLKGPNSDLVIRSNAYQFYQNKEYPAAIPLFEQLIAEEGEEQGDYFYLGLSYLYTNQPQKAAKNLKILLDAPPNNYEDIATWYLALALTSAKDYDEAKIYLSKVATWTGNKGKEESAKDAVELMRVIDEIE